MKKISSSAAVLLLCAAVAGGATKPAKHVRVRTKTIASSAEDEAARVLFLRSDLDGARAAAAKAIRSERNDVRALFVEMEAAALEADTQPMLEAALRLCETKTDDARVNIAAARVLDQAGNTPDFRAAVPRIEKLIAAGSPQAPYLRAALLAAAQDGVPGLAASAIAREAGIVTRWRINGPFGKRPNVDWEQRWQPETEARLAAFYDGRKTEDFQFLDGNVALPEYFRANDGVFYGESVITVPRAAEYTLRLESAGTAEIFLDGAVALLHDGRLRQPSDMQHVTAHLDAGEHRLLVKFLAGAAPFRVTLLLPAPASRQRAGAATTAALDAEARYLRVATAYWDGDVAGVVTALPTPENAAEDFLLGRALARLSPGSDAPEAVAHYRAAAERSPAALAALYEVAAADFAAGRVQDAATSAEKIAALRPAFVPGQELLSEAAERLGWDRIAMRAFENRILLHPSCDTLQKAARLFAKSARYDRARALEDGLKDCGLQTMAYANALGERGEHAAAAAEAARLAGIAPLDRAALVMLEKESRLAGDESAAVHAASELERIAPNRSARVRESSGEFYLSYRREGLALARSTAARRFSGGPIVTVLEDDAVRLNADGSADEYVHRLTRVLTKEGIEQYGEAAPPAGAELLELRTIKADGRVFEPELHEHKQTISMPSLAPEDVIELEYLLHHAAGEALAESPEIFRHVFGSFSAPVLYSRFAVEIPASVNVRIVSAPSLLPSLHTERRDGMVVYRWEANDVAQSLLEPSMPAAANLPAVALLPAYADWDDVRDHYRELAFEAAGAGTDVHAALMALHPERAATEEELARHIVAYVQKNVAASDANAFASGDVPSAEDSLANGEGSRTVAALALAHAAGLDVRLILARGANSAPTPEISLQTFTKTLLGFAFHGKSGERMVFADVETQGLAFGALPPEIAAGDALSIPLARPRAGSALIALRVPPAREENFADADIRVTAAGDADARLDIRMGSFRGAQMRATLRNLRGAARQQFYEQIALRIFRGALSVTGTVRHEDDTDRPLTLELRCHVPGFVNFARLALEDSIDIDQLVPALGLKRMYATQASRKFALAIELPLFESTTFRLHLPAGLAMPQSARDVRLATSFGDYILEFRQPDARTIEVRRSFRIPVQTVSAGAYAEFARFAQQIEDAERQRLTLARASGSVPAASGGE
jgi:hypothetical protein